MHSAPTSPWTSVDNALGTLVSDPQWRDSWLLNQTVASSVSRRALAWSLPVPPGGTVVDVGCGFGAFAVELATRTRIRAVGVDFDSSVLGAARQLGHLVTSAPENVTGSSVDFVTGDAYALPFADRSVDFAVERFVMQHLQRPDEAAVELARVVKPGASVCVIDTDDGLSISEPPSSAAFDRLAAALRSTQTGRGGDRYVGRKLAGIVDRAGLSPIQVVVLPQAWYGSTSAEDPSRHVLRQRFSSARQEIVSSGLMTASDFDSDLDHVAGESSSGVCEIEAHVAVIATRR